MKRTTQALNPKPRKSNLKESLGLVCGQILVLLLGPAPWLLLLSYVPEDKAHKMNGPQNEPPKKKREEHVYIYIYIEISIIIVGIMMQTPIKAHSKQQYCNENSNPMQLLFYGFRSFLWFCFFARRTCAFAFICNLAEMGLLHFAGNLSCTK